MRIGARRYLHSDSGRLAAADRTVANVGRPYLIQANGKVCRIGGDVTGVESQRWPHLLISSPIQEDNRIAITGLGNVDIESSAAGAGKYCEIDGDAQS